MAEPIPVGCRCEKVRGTLQASRRNSHRAYCYCKDCQAFARYLGTEGILDTSGGSDLIQIAPSQLRIDTGANELACVRLSPKGLLRWYTACCRTPVGNGMASSRIPFISVVQPFVMHESTSSRDATFGPPRLYVHSDAALGPLPPGASTKVSVRTAARYARFLLVGFALGRHRPTPFFDAAGQPVVKPEVLSKKMHHALREGLPV